MSPQLFVWSLAEICCAVAVAVPTMVVSDSLTVKLAAPLAAAALLATLWAWRRREGGRSDYLALFWRRHFAARAYQTLAADPHYRPLVDRRG